MTFCLNGRFHFCLQSRFHFICGNDSCMYDKRLIASIFILATQKSHFRSRFQNQKVRQSFTNAIIHSDLLMDAGILRVEKHNDRYRLCFRNPGLLRLPIEQIFEGGVSYARNPKIQNILRMVGYGENLGSGFPLILDAWKQAGWNTPVLNNRFELDMVELVLPLYAVSEKSPSSTVEMTPSAEIDDREKSREKNINIIRDNPTVTQLELSNILIRSPKSENSYGVGVFSGVGKGNAFARRPVLRTAE